MSRIGPEMLRNRLIRLAYSRPDLRSHLIPLLKVSNATEFYSIHQKKRTMVDSFYRAFQSVREIITLSRELEQVDPLTSEKILSEVMGLLKEDIIQAEKAFASLQMEYKQRGQRQPSQGGIDQVAQPIQVPQWTDPRQTALPDLPLPPLDLPVAPLAPPSAAAPNDSVQNVVSLVMNQKT